jgi:hypothetical protein
VLTVLKDGVYEPLSAEEMDAFESQHPDLALLWRDPTALEALPLPRFPDQAPLYETWDKAAKRLLSQLRKSPHARHFQEPVDLKTAPNYLTMVKDEPMDLGTVKLRLSTNYYHRMQEFLDDVQLIFENCIAYYGQEESNSGAS